MLKLKGLITAKRVAPRGAEPVSEKFPRYQNKILKLGDAFDVIDKCYDYVKLLLPVLPDVGFVRYYIPEPTLWLPAVGAYGSGERESVMIQHWMDDGEIAFIMQDRSDKHFGPRAPFRINGYALLWNKRLDQDKKRRWGLFIPTKHRNSKHRGPKRDRLCLRVPHK